jgi:ABC-2 type transport system ATP-binding protein
VSAESAVSVESLRHRYGAIEALRGISLSIPCGEIFGLLGPNGGGKTTLFRILATSIVPDGGQVRVFGHDVMRERAHIRPLLGVVFQSPSLDKKLTAAENLMHHGHLYGLYGSGLRRRVHEMLDRVGLSDRANDRIERLSGGMQRRVEVAKGLLHQPRLMLMDEPSTGLDPRARLDWWRYLKQARDHERLTVLLTTHLMDEAALCDRVAILDRGQVVAIGPPGELAAEIGHDVVLLECRDPQSLADRIRNQLGLACSVVDESIRIEHELGHKLIAQLFDEFPGEILSVTVRRPSLEDVFIRKTGHRF